MSTKKKFFLVFCFILIDVFLLIGFLVIRDATSFNALKSEVKELESLDFTKDRYNRKIKSHGKYAVVEKAIKEYLDEYAVGIQDLSKMTKDSKLSNILSYDNYSSDGPSFTSSIKYLNDSKSNLNNQIDYLLRNLDEDGMNSYVSGKISDQYYISIFDELMSSSEMKSDLDNIRTSLEKTKNDMNNIYDVSLEVLNYLSLYSDKWKLEDGEIKFASEDMYNYYMGLVSKVKKKEE